MAKGEKYAIIDHKGRHHLITFWGKGWIRKIYTAKIQVNVSESLTSNFRDVLAIAGKRAQCIGGLSDETGKPKPAGPKFLSPKLLKKGMTIFYGEACTKGVRIQEFTKVKE